MRHQRFGRAALVVSVALMLMTVAPGTVSAAPPSEEVLGAKSTDGSDFNNAQTLDNVSVAGNSVKYDNIIGPSFTYSFAIGDTPRKAGFKFTTESNQTHISGTISDSTGAGGETTAYLLNATTGNVLESTTISSEKVTIFHPINKSESYYFVVDAGGQDYTYARTSVSYPREKNGVNLTSGYTSFGGGTEYDDRAFVFEDVGFYADAGQYRSQNYSIQHTSSGYVNVTTAANASYTVSFHESDGSLLASQSFTGAGNRTLSWQQSSATSVYTNVTISKTGPAPQLEIIEDGVRFIDQAPVVDNSTAAPVSDIEQGGITLSVNVSDREFSTPQGESVSAEFFVQAPGESGFTSVGTDTIASNGTVSTNYQANEAGEFNWYIVATDSYGVSQSSSTFTFSSVSTLTVRNESKPTEVLDNVSVQLQFYFDNDDSADLIVEREVQNGSINMTGLPADESFIVVAQADGFRDRRIYVESLYETQTVYLLADTQPFVEQLFDLRDFSGRFPSDDTVLEVQRALTRDYDGDGQNETRWQTVVGDFFGATGEFSVQIRSDVRYRLVLTNADTGYSVEKGDYTPISSGTKTIRVTGEGDIEISELAATIDVGPDIRQLPASDSAQVSVSVNNHSNTLEYWHVTVAYQNNTATETLFDQNNTDPDGGSVKPTLNLSNRTNGTVFVNVSIKTELGFQDRTSVEFRLQELYQNQWALVPVLGTLEAQIPAGNWQMFSTLLAVILTALSTTAIASQFNISTEMVGAVAIGHLVFFAILSLLSYNIVFAAGAAWAGMTALRRGI